MVATPSGPVPIEALKVGDLVVGFENDKPVVTTVTATFDNGEKWLVDLVSSNRTYLSATVEHKLWACNESDLDKRRPHLYKGFDRVKVEELTRRVRVRRTYLGDMITGGPKPVKHTYSLGALIGDGCSRDNKATTGKRQKTLKISSGDDVVPRAVAEDLGCEFRRAHENNNTWTIDVGKGALNAVPFYRDWCAGKYAHEKVIEWEEVDSWERESALRLLAGLIDTDGAVYFKSAKSTELVVQLGMQSRSVVEAARKLMFKYFQEWFILSEDRRDKYKNGSVWCIKSTSNSSAIRILAALKPHLKKKGTMDVPGVKLRNVRDDRIGLAPSGGRLCKTYDITVSLESNLYVLHHGGIVTSNSGKTELGKRYLKKMALLGTAFRDPRFFAAAPTRDQAKRIYWEDLKRMIPSHMKVKTNETDLMIRIINGSEIWVLGMDKPERIEGPPWDGGILDEYANMKEKTWGAHVRPALSDRMGWAWLIGVPEGRNHYHEIYQYARHSGDLAWDGFTWFSKDILPPEEIEAAQRDLDPLVFQQEYEASFIHFSGRVYYNFTEHEHLAPLKYDPKQPIAFCFDFNVAPGVACVVQEQPLPLAGILSPGWLEGTGVIGEVWIPRNSNTPAVCKKLIKDWGDHRGLVYCYGDATGGASGTAQTQGSDWDLIRDAMRRHFGDRVIFRQFRANPPQRARINAVNSRLKNGLGEVRLMVDPSRAPHVYKDLEGVIVLEGGSGEIDKKGNPELTHISDALGYYVAREFKVLARGSTSMELQ